MRRPLKFVYIFTLLLLHSYSGFGQNYILKISQSHIRDYIQFEKTRGTVQKEYYGNYFDFTWPKLGKPVQFIDTTTDFQTPTSIEYIFTVPDSIVRIIYVEIDSANFDQPVYVENNERMPGFNHQYNLILEDVIKILGTPGDSVELAISTNGNWSRDAEWENDSLDAKLHFTFHNQNNGRGQTRVRLGIYFKNPNKSEFKKPENITPVPEQDALAQKYISNLLNKKLKECWDLTDPALQEKISFEQFTRSLTPIADLKKEWGKEVVLYATSKMFSLTGESTLLYMYRFKKDKNRVPQVIINVTFRDSESSKIIGIRANTQMGSTK